MKAIRWLWKRQPSKTDRNKKWNTYVRYKSAIPFYSLTGSGYFISQLIKMMNLRELLNKSSVKNGDYQKELSEIKDKLYKFIQSNFKRHNSYHTIALAKEYEIYKHNGWSDTALVLIEFLLHNGSEMTVYEAIEDANLVNIKEHPEIHIGMNKLFLKALNSMDEKTKFVKSIEVKAMLENRIIDQVPTREWEELRLHHLNDYSIVILFGKCHNCGWEDFVEADPILFYTEYMENSANSTTCPKCKEPELHVSTDLPPNRMLSIN